MCSPRLTQQPMQYQGKEFPDAKKQCCSSTAKFGDFDVTQRVGVKVSTDSGQQREESGVCRTVAVVPASVTWQEGLQHCLSRYQPILDYFDTHAVNLYKAPGINNKKFFLYQDIKKLERLLKNQIGGQAPFDRQELYGQEQLVIDRIKKLANIGLLKDSLFFEDLQFFECLHKAGFIERKVGDMSLDDISFLFEKAIFFYNYSNTDWTFIIQNIDTYYIARPYPEYSHRIHQVIMMPQLLLHAVSRPMLSTWWQNRCTELNRNWQDVAKKVIESCGSLDFLVDRLMRAPIIDEINIENNFHLFIFQAACEKIVKCFLDENCIRQADSINWLSVSSDYSLKTLFGFNIFLYFELIFFCSRKWPVKNIPSGIINGIFQYLVANVPESAFRKLDLRWVLEQLMGQGAEIKDPDSIITHWVTHQAFNKLLDATERLPQRLLSQMKLGQRLSFQQLGSKPLFVVLVTDVTLSKNNLAYLLPNISDSVLRQGLVAVYQQLSLPVSDNQVTLLLRNFYTIWWAIRQPLQDSIARELACTQVLSSPETCPLMSCILQQAFAKGRFDRIALQQGLLSYAQRLADHGNQGIQIFFKQINQFAIPELNRWLLHQYLYHPDLELARKLCFPTCLPFYRCKNAAQWHPLTTLLLGAFVQQPRFSPDLGGGFDAQIETFIDTQKETLTAGSKYPEAMPSADRAEGIYGRTILFSPEPNSERVYRLKLGKKGEKQEDFLREMPALQYLRQQKSDGQLPLNSKLPVPVDVFYLSDFQHWLQQSGLSPDEQSYLNDHVHMDQQGNALAYLYYTETAEERYQHYVYERQLDGYDRDDALTSLSRAASDMGMLWHRGICFDNPIPLYHSDAGSQWLMFMPAVMTCGGIIDWNGATTDYPNIAPLPSLLRDFGDIHSANQVIHRTPYSTGATTLSSANAIAKMLQALELLLARVLQPEIREAGQNPNSQETDDTIGLIRSSLKTLYYDFARHAFGVVVADRFVTAITTHPSGAEPSILEQAAREILYFMETSDDDQIPRYIQDMMEQRPCPLYPSENQPLPYPLNLTLRGVKYISNDAGVMLTHPNQTMPLVQCTHMKYRLLAELAAALEFINNSPTPSSNRAEI